MRAVSLTLALDDVSRVLFRRSKQIFPSFPSSGGMFDDRGNPKGR